MCKNAIIVRQTQVNRLDTNTWCGFESLQLLQSSACNKWPLW